ncbi:MAG: hypothetical protein IKA03_00565 [Alphaproteobacteria bacterium]|nr:hypothetical protein [Alphaproteobacteria bacterium]
MKSVKQNKVLSFFVVLFFVVVNASITYAQVVDFLSVFQSVKDTTTQIKESETVVKTIGKVKKMSAAIGTAKKTVTELKAAYEEKVKKQIEKTQKYIDEAKKYKAEYDKYKAQLDTAISKAKELKDKVEDGIDKANDMKDKIENGIDKAKSAADSIKDKLGDSNETANNTYAVTNTDNEVSSDNVLLPKTTISKKVKPAVRQPFVENKVEEVPSANISNSNLLNNTDEQSKEKVREDATEGVAPAEKTDVRVDPKKNDGSKMSSISGDVVTDISVKYNDTITPLKFDIQKQRIVKNDISAVEIDKKSNNKPTLNRNTEKLNYEKEDVQTKKSQNSLQERISLRKTFKSSSLRYSEKFAFAKIDAMPDGGTDANGTIIIPKKLAMFCNLSSANAQSGTAMENCLLKLNKERMAPQADNPYNAPAIYNIAMAQYVAASIAEAFKALNDAESFEEKVVEPIEFAEEPTVQDVYSNIVEMNKAVDQQMNGLLKIYSAQLVAKTIKNYGDYIFLPPEKEGDNG